MPRCPPVGESRKLEQPKNDKVVQSIDRRGEETEA